MLGIDEKTVCIATAGMGTRMGRYANVINKALLPIREKAAISHIIEAFPERSNFVILLGYQSMQVRDYLALAHPSIMFRYVHVDDWHSERSGPGPSLLAARETLTKAFVYVTCDALVTRVKQRGNWIGVSDVPMSQRESYCNVEVIDDVVTAIHDKVAARNTKAFTGMMQIEDTRTFFAALEAAHAKGNVELSPGFGALSDLHACPHAWTDIGTAERYKDAIKNDGEFVKDGEFFYHVGNRVIKFFADGSIVANRRARSEMHPGIFPSIMATDQDDPERVSNFYAYEWVKGKTLYEVASPAIMTKLLDWLSENLWVQSPCADFRSAIREFYIAKTENRLAAFESENKEWVVPATIMGVDVPAIKTLLAAVPWDSLCEGKPSFIHGDLQFANIIYTSTSFKLIDWRQDFAGMLDCGDIAYDFGKMIAGSRVNFAELKSGNYIYREDNGDAYLQTWSMDNREEIEELIFEHAADYGVTRDRLEIIVGLIYLNMSGVHQAPLNRLLYCLAVQHLAKTLGGSAA